jgi:hypothetical protein
MLTKQEAAAHLGIHEATLIRWTEYGIVTRHAYTLRRRPRGRTPRAQER